MSLHAPLSNEAKLALASQQRQSTISSVLIAALAIVLIALTLYVINLNTLVRKPQDLQGFVLPSVEPPRPEKPKFTNAIPRKPSLPALPQNSGITAIGLAPDSLPEPESPEITPTIIGEIEELTAIDLPDDEEYSADPWQKLPPSMVKRCSKQDRLERLQQSGGVPRSEDAVIRSLDHFARTQDADGGWHGKSNYPAGYTGLALLSFLGHCETPTSAKYGETVEEAIIYLINLAMKNEGKIASDFHNKHWPYEHAICTYALAEAFTLCSKQGIDYPNHADAVKASAQFIIDNQDKQNGGWGYAYIQSGQDGAHVDTSVACWQLQALKAAKHSGLDGLKHIETAANKGLKYLESAQRGNGAIHYTPHGGSPTMTGGAVLCFQQWNKGNRSTPKKGIDYIHDNISFDYESPQSDLYAHYYYGQAMMNAGGKFWKQYNGQFRDSLLNAQNDDGTYKQPGNGGPINGVATGSYSGKAPHAVHYRTALATLMLEVYYRFLPGTATH